MNKEERLYSLDKLTEMDGADSEFIRQIIDIFLSTVPASAEELMQAYMNKDLETVYFIAHKMKANINLLNIHHIKDDILLVEQNAKSGTNTESMGEKINHILEIVNKASKQMKEDFQE